MSAGELNLRHRCRRRIPGQFPPSPFRSMSTPIRLIFLCWCCAFFGGLERVNAQWLSQSFVLKPGWNAIHLHINATNTTLENLVGINSPITEIWLWQPSGSEARILNKPAAVSGSDWVQWTRATGPAEAFPLRANWTYLVRNTNSIPYTWTLKGKPVPPSTDWTVSGLNFIGFSTRSDTAPFFSNFLTPTTALNEFTLFHYPGGEALGAPPNAATLFSLNTRRVTRGEAFWVKRGNSGSGYFGPFETVLQNHIGISFSDSLGVYSFRLRNQLSVSNTISASFLASESSPTGDTPPFPPLLLRTSLDTTTLKYGFMALGAGIGTNLVLAPKGRPGSEVEVVLGLDRSNMAGPTGTTFAGILRLTDTTLGQLQVDLPITAIKSSTEGLWVGEASIHQVGNYLKTYAKATNAVDFTNQLARLTALNDSQKRVVLTNDTWAVQAFTFTDRSPFAESNHWVAVASSADGARLVGAISGGRLYTSADTGATWTARDSDRNWSAVATSANGARLIAAVAGGELYVSTDAGSTWAAKETARNWSSVASSSDGTRLVAAVSGGQIYVSADGGETWAPHESARTWVSVASSADGTHLVAAAGADQLFTSVDAGETWTPRETSRAWVSVASSANGTNLVAAETGGQLYISGNGGVSWSPQESARAWTSVASSASGTKLMALVAGGLLYVSGDSGVTWSGSETNRDWRSVALSSDGSRGVAVAYDGQIYLSKDSGNSWGVAAPFVSGLASSADGMKLVATAKGSRVYTSVDGGTNWTSQLSAPVSDWQSVASSADGTKLVAAVDGGGVYVSTDSGGTWSSTGAPSAHWQAVASSDDGLKLFAVSDGADIYASVDGGQTWVSRVPVAGQAWQAVACSSDGQRVIAGTRSGQLYASVNGGVAWQALFGVPGNGWQAVASSADGKSLYAAQNPGGIYASTDAGVTWDLKASAPPTAQWQALTCSTNGIAVVAVVKGGKIFTSSDAGKSWTQRDENRTWAAVATSSDGTRLVASASSAMDQVFTEIGTLETPSISYDPASGMILSGGGKYLTASFNTELGDVPTPFPLRLIVHHGADGLTKLLQRVYIGPSASSSNTILTLQESKLDKDQLSKARRLSAVHLPLSGAPWSLVGDFGGVGIMNTVLTDGFNNTASNPFLHAYHPDHDNMDALYQPITKPGTESYDVKRQITLSFTPPGDDFTSRTTGDSRVSGTYLENIVLKGGNNQTRTVVTKGSFILNRISGIATLQ